MRVVLGPDGAPRSGTCGFISDWGTWASDIVRRDDGTFFIVGYLSGQPQSRQEEMRLWKTSAPDAPLDLVATYSKATGGVKDFGLALTAEGSPVVGFNTLSDSGTGWVLRLHRYLSNGALDPTFGTGGVVQYSGGASTSGNALTRLPDGKLVVMGVVNSGVKDVFALRLLPDGQLDSTFSGGVVHIESLENEGGLKVVPLEDGGLMLGGRSGSSPSGVRLARLLSDGTLDSTFGEGGQLRLPSTEGALVDFLVRPGGKLLVITTKGLLQLLPDGSLDPDFAPGGTPPFRLSPTVGKLAEDGTLVLLGTVINPLDYRRTDFAMQRIRLP
ncbi:delta-60 repeat domain-containing protein [Vitiosangium sp. GDMCC 1.1324]|uniref:delta-60 repeat domain-containing protein n=1 Tax=Vitiosangium sp. (strain GDMCC 1.1324) TaxID=2138576 RepID=UPI0018EE9323|nr:delta-60 repeat domain-containing protein [Vitiosangium sp. GDMCC 1.1324]